MIAVVLLALVGTIEGPGPDDPSPKALFEAFRANVRAFGTLKVQWRRDEVQTEEGKAARNREITKLEADAANLEDGSEAFHKVNAEINSKKQVIAASWQPKVQFQTFLTDRDRFLMRDAPPNWGGMHGDDDWLMPDVPVTPASMAKQYVGFTLIAYQGGGNPFYRWCVGQPNGVNSWGQIMVQLPGNCYFPPLASPKNANSAYWRHPIDAFFREDPGAFRTVGHATVDGHDTVLIERRTSSSPKEPPVEVVRAYLDPSRGALPLKIEWFPPGADPDKRPLFRAMDGVEIVAVKGGGFYPVRGTIRTFIDGDSGGPPVSVEEISWQAAKVEGNAPLNDTMALEFPDGMYYYDGSTGRQQRVGQEEFNDSRLPMALSGAIVAGWAVYGAAALVVALVRRPQRLEPEAGVS